MDRKRKDFPLLASGEPELISLANGTTPIRDLNDPFGNQLFHLDEKKDTMVLTSDHGNLEDYHQRGHTRNPVPLITWGRHGDFLRGKIRSLSDVTPSLLDLFGR